MARKRKSQVERVKTWLTSGKSINPLTAVKRLNIFRLAAVIHRLRNEHGLSITTDTRRGFATYKLTA